MSNNKITVKEYVRVNGYSDASTLYVIGKKYSKDTVKTSKQWESQLLKDKVIDKTSSVVEEEIVDVVEEKTPLKQSESAK